VAIAGAAIREAGLEPGEAPDAAARRKGRIAIAITSAVMLVVVLLGNAWWSTEANNYARYVYTPLQLTAKIADVRSRKSEVGSPKSAAVQTSAMHMAHPAALSSAVSFPYGFPEPGECRIFVQIKRAGRIQTAAFDARVDR